MGKTQTILPPERSTRQLAKILEALAILQADGIHPMNSWVEMKIHSLPRGCIIVMTTPSSDNDILILANFLRHTGMHPVVIWLDAGTFGAEKTNPNMPDYFNKMGIPFIKVISGEDISRLFSI
jgi:hypothetical protein